jgi:hypothetical protein
MCIARGSRNARPLPGQASRHVSQPVSKQRLMHGARLSQPFCPVDSSSASISRLHPYGPPLASPSICMLGSRRREGRIIALSRPSSYTKPQQAIHACEWVMRYYSMTALRGPCCSALAFLATLESCTRLSSISNTLPRACACAAPVDRGQHASSIPPVAMASSGKRTDP